MKLRETKQRLLEVARRLSVANAGPSCAGLCRYEKEARDFARQVANLLAFDLDPLCEACKEPQSLHVKAVAATRAGVPVLWCRDPHRGEFRVPS